MPPIPPPLIRPADPNEAAWLQESYTKIGWSKPAGYFAACCQLQAEGKLVLLVAEGAGTYLGHCKVVWQPDYLYFRENNIPEIQDLNVLAEFRRQGVASRLVDEAERLIGQRSAWVGIRFGLYRDYGPAQRMYIRRGYVPDGQGIAYNDAYVEPGRSYPVDDELTLGLVKRLR
jgi:GNAT superfamily N-acetyltransferase